jgi:hypothetical protein
MQINLINNFITSKSMDFAHNKQTRNEILTSEYSDNSPDEQERHRIFKTDRPHPNLD